VAAVRDRLFGEIYKTLDFYFTEHREQKLAKLTIVGGGSNMAGLAVQIDHFLGENQAMLLDTFSVELLNPLHFVEHKLGEEEAKLLGPALAVAIGLALEEVVTR
ncbi:MAG: pilus assembly protein PilM, partial [Thermaerobacter sp.]|nr:pilus assembly protein PilM [Thermaerobacter sp.]